MAWYAAHIVSYVKFKDAIQDRFPLWENIVLISAESVDAAYEEAEKIGKESYDDTEDPDNSGDMTWDGRPAYWVFAGVRKLAVCTADVNDEITETDPQFRPTHGTEVTYLEMEVSTQEELAKLVDGASVIIRYDQ